MIDQPDIYLPFDLSDVIGGYTKIGDKYNAPGERLSVTLRPNEVIQDMESVLPENFFNIYIGNSPYGEVRYLNDERMVSTHEMEISEPNWSSLSVIGCAVSDQYFAPYGYEDDYCAMKEGYTKIYFECMVMEIIADWNPETGETIPSSYYYNQIYPVDVFIGGSMGSSYSDLWSVDGVVQDWLFKSYKSAFYNDPIWSNANSYTDIDICDLNADLRGVSSVQLFGSGFNNSNGGEKKIPPVIQYISADSVDLDFSDSGLTGELPAALSQISTAQGSLDLSGNQLSGNIITEYPNAGSMALNVQDNQFTGFSGNIVNLSSIDLGVNFLSQADISGISQNGLAVYGQDMQYQVGVQDDFITVASGQTVNADFLKNYMTISLNGKDYTPDTAASQLELGIVPGESFFNVFSGSNGSYTKKADGIAEAWFGFTETKAGTAIEQSDAVGGSVKLSTYSANQFIINSAVNPADKNVYCGTPAANLNLPAAVQATAITGETKAVNVTWDTSSYKPSIVGTYTIPGTIALTNGVVNPKNIKVQIKVNVLALSISGVTNPADISAEYGTPVNELDLPTTVEITYNTGEKDTVPVAWDTSSYQSAVPGTYTLPGTLTLAENVENPNQLKAQVKVTVTPLSVESVTNPADIIVEYGTPVNELGLPTTVEVTYHTGEKEPVSVTWDTSTYNAEQPGDYTFPGTLTLAAGVENPNNIRPEIKVTVKKQRVTGVTNPADISVEYGTSVEQLGLPTTVEVTYNTGEKDTVNVAWDTSLYQSTVPGIYMLPGTLTLPENVENPNQLKAQIKVTVKKRYVTGVTNPADISVAYGTPVEQLGLPEAVRVTYNVGDPSDINVTWDTSAYHAAEPGDYTFTGTLALPEDTENPDDLAAEITVIVTRPYYNITGVLPIADIEVEYDTPQSELALPGKATVILDRDGGQRELDVTWAPENGYDPALAGQPQAFIGTFSALPENVENQENRTAAVNVIVKAQEPEGGNIVSFVTKQITAFQSVPLAQIQNLPETVTAYLDNGQTAELPVVWNDAESGAG